MSLIGYKSDTTRQFQTINPRFGTSVQFFPASSQGFRLENEPPEFILARNNRDMSEYNLSETMEEYVYRAKSAYWNLVYSRKNLNVRRQSLKLARSSLEK